jgi:formate-dependent nitrite reductase membrane component NrfD
MTHEEKRSWIMLAVSVIAYSAYVGIVLSRSDGQPLASTGYVTPLLCTIGAAIGATILLDIAVDIARPRTTREKDVRDREIGRFGESMGQAFVVIGAVAALLMALAEWDWFWIANVIYLCFVLSAVLSSTAKIVAYRGGLPQW